MTDIRVGDLVKATWRGDPESIKQFRVTYLDNLHVDGILQFARREHWDFEVLDRPLPPIDEELLTGANDAYRKAVGYNLYDSGVKALINFIREYDRTYNKENA